LNAGLIVTETANSLGFADGNAMGMLQGARRVFPTEWRRSRDSSSHYRAGNGNAFAAAAFTAAAPRLGMHGPDVTTSSQTVDEAWAHFTVL